MSTVPFTVDAASLEREGLRRRDLPGFAGMVGPVWTSGRRPCVIVQLGSQFLAAARDDLLLVARGRVPRSDASLVFMQGEVTADGSVVVAASAVLKSLNDQRRPAGRG